MRFDLTLASKHFPNPSYLLVLSDDTYQIGDHILNDKGRNLPILIENSDELELFAQMAAKKIIAHLPLNNAEYLKDVPVLPPLTSEPSIEQKAVDFAGDRNLGGGHGYPSYTANLLEKGYLKGFSDAKETYEYTKEDLAKVFYVGVQLGINQEIATTSNKPLQDEESILNKCVHSLKQPKLPIAFETEDVITSVENDEPFREIKLTFDENGRTQWMGKYIL